MVYACRDVAIILRQLKFKSHIPQLTKKSFQTDFRSRKQREIQNQIMKFYVSGNVHFVYTTSLLFDVLGRLFLRIRNNQNIFIVNRYSSISCIKDKSIATCANVVRLLLLFENLRLTLAKKRCEWECNKTIISETFCVFPFVKTSGYHLKVFIFKLN